MIFRLTMPRAALALAAALTSAATAMTIAPAPAAGQEVRDGASYRIIGPSCRLMRCWAMVADDTGQGTLVEGRGIIGTRALAEARLHRLTAEATAAGRVCFGGETEL
jgi:hypothetical protein